MPTKQLKEWTDTAHFAFKCGAEIKECSHKSPVKCNKCSLRHNKPCHPRWACGCGNRVIVDGTAYCMHWNVWSCRYQLEIPGQTILVAPEFKELIPVGYWNGHRVTDQGDDPSSHDIERILEG